MTQALSLPGNTERVYLDVIAQSESNDEFWYLFGPNDRITNFESCGNTAFRETERATTANGSIGSITVDSNRNFIISGYVNTLQGCVETTVRESVNLEASITSTLTPRPTFWMRCEPQLSNRRRPATVS
jgi:hypothetical protein